MAERYFQQVQDVLSVSFLSEFPDAALTRILGESRLVHLPAGTVTTGRTDLPRAGVVVEGLLRLFLISPDGRQVTVRYVRPGGTVGVVALVGGSTPVTGQALADTTLLALNPETLHLLAREDKLVSWAMAEELTRILIAVMEDLAANTFGTVKQRVALHILSIASVTRAGRPVIAAVTQQDLADAIGTVREVVARTISDLSGLGLVQSTRAGIRVLDAAGLHKAAWNTRTNQAE